MNSTRTISPAAITTDQTSTISRSVLGSLRALPPQRDSITFGEALRVAELQATRLGQLLDATGDGITESDIARLPRITVTYERLPVSGMSHWNGRSWIIAIALADSLVRQRFTLLHEFKHIVDHGQAARLYRGDRARSTVEQAELAADYFAGCALVPKRLLKAAWGNGVQRVADLAGHFGVSEHAIRVRLAQTGLDTPCDREPSPRCARPISTPHSQRQRFRAIRYGFRQGRYA